MVKKIVSLVIIFIFSVIAWNILGGVTSSRTYSQDSKLKDSVADLWGSSQMQKAPDVSYTVTRKWVETRLIEGKKTEEKMEETKTYPVNPESSDITADINLSHRKKGLLWYSTYKVSFNALYCIVNPDSVSRDISFDYYFPSSEGVYDNFVIMIDNQRVSDVKPVSGRVRVTKAMEPGKKHYVKLSYDSQGLDEWWYLFGSGVTQVRDFKLVLNTDFDRIDFPQRGISPTDKKKTEKGWELTWKYTNLLSGIQIGLEMPKKLNPGPFVSQISFFAPVSLFFFFFLMFIITTIKGIKIHPLNYFFIAASFFSFHLLMAYMADLVSIYTAFAVSAAVSVFLVISYMRLVVGIKFAMIEVGISQIVYLVVFSSAFFLEGYTGFAITILAIATLFIVMQMTGRIDWEKQFSEGKKQEAVQGGKGRKG